MGGNERRMSISQNTPTGGPTGGLGRKHFSILNPKSVGVAKHSKVSKCDSLAIVLVIITCSKILQQIYTYLFDFWFFFEREMVRTSIIIFLYSKFDFYVFLASFSRPS